MKLRIRSNLFLVLVVVAGALAAVPAQAQDVSGSWLMDMDGTLSGEVAPCIYSGDCVMNQTGSDLTGTVQLSLVSGPVDCPAEITASVVGTVAGDSVSGILEGPPGQAEFSGNRVEGFVGTFNTILGDFAGSEGDWLAVRPPSVLEIPTLTGAGLTLLVLALLAGGTFLLRSRRDAPQSS